jgi:hypothetical protein
MTAGFAEDVQYLIEHRLAEDHREDLLQDRRSLPFSHPPTGRGPITDNFSTRSSTRDAAHRHSVRANWRRCERAGRGARGGAP